MAMKRVRVAELKDHLSEHLRSVERGAKVLVLDRDRPIAQIVPVPVASPAVELVPARRAFGAADRRASAPVRWSVTSLELLAEERREG